VETIPPGWRGTIETSQAPSDPISRRLRDAFDPARILNRGILGEEAS
jgi:FAD/FMN-containing dehydrogenase